MTRGWAEIDRMLAVMAARPERERLKPSQLARALRALPDLTTGPVPEPDAAGSPPDLRVSRMRTVCRRLIRQAQYAQAADLLELVLARWTPDPRLGLHALAAHASTSLTGEAPSDLVTAAAAALQGADRALAQGDLAVTAELVVVGAGLLLHRDLHADVEHSPLVDDTAAFLAPFRASRAMAALVAPRTEQTAGRPEPVNSAPGQPSGPLQPDTQRQDRRRVVVLPGAYPRFAAPVVAALRERPDVAVEVVDLVADHPSFRWLGTDPELVRLRLADRAAAWPTDSDEPFAVTAEQLEAVQTADVVVADWADKGAVWASLVVPDSTRLVLRIHGMDTLGLWPHVIDWSQVDALLAPSPHQGETLRDVVVHGASGVAIPPVHVLPNIVRLPPVADPPPRDPHALVMVGWASRVKDPLWAVEVLAGLLARGGDWRLVLVGDGFRPGTVVTTRDYAEAFAERTGATDVADHVHRVPHTDDVAREVAAAGFVLSASLRESFHQGLVEGVLGGAVPVVRNWPYFARRDGARRLYPSDWVVDDVTAAVDRIWALRDETDRAVAAQQARGRLDDRFEPGRVGTDLVRVILGESTPDERLQVRA